MRNECPLFSNLELAHKDTLSMSEPGGLPTLERLRAALSSQPSVLAEVDAMVAKGDMTEKEIVSNVISKASPAASVCS